MYRDGFSAQALRLMLAASVVFLTSFQSVSAFATVGSRLPSLASLCYASTPHTREEVGDRGVDLSVKANRAPAQRSSESLTSFQRPRLGEDIEVEVSPPSRTLHRRISPSSPDDAFSSVQ